MNNERKSMKNFNVSVQNTKLKQESMINHYLQNIRKFTLQYMYRYSSPLSKQKNNKNKHTEKLAIIK